MIMKRTLLAFRWFIGSLILGSTALGILLFSGYYVPSGTKVTSEAVANKALFTGLTFWVFLIGVPVVTLILAIREVTTSVSAIRAQGNEPPPKPVDAPNERR